jgi:hypothetical protein
MLSESRESRAYTAAEVENGGIDAATIDVE